MRLSKLFFFVAIGIVQMTCSRSSGHTSDREIALFIQTWGYLKYFHPNVASGTINWDAEFVACYPTAQVSLRDAIEKMLKDVDGPKSYGMNSNHNKNVQFADFRWMDDTLFTPNERQAFHAIYSNEVPELSRYVWPYSHVGNPNFSAEDTTYVNPYPDEAHRMLALARYWNAIEYYYPDLNLIPSWSDTLLTYLPRIQHAQNADAYQLSMVNLSCSISDGHSSTNSITIGDLFGHYYLPLPLTHIGNTIVFRKPRAYIDLPFHPGDILVSLGDEGAVHIIQRYGSLVPHSNSECMMRNICRTITSRRTTDSVEITYKTFDGSIHSTKMKPLNMDEWKTLRSSDSNPAWKILDENIGYIDMGKFKMDDVEPAMKAFKQTKAIIFDIRNYPNGTAWVLGSKLGADAQWADFRMPDYSEPGSFKMTSLNHAPTSPASYHGKVIALVNSETQSHAEYTAMMIRSIPGSIIIGSQTAGADGNVSTINLPGGITTMFSGLGVYYPDGKPTQQIGIVPDITVTPTIKGLRDGRDEVLDKAIETANR